MFRFLLIEFPLELLDESIRVLFVFRQSRRWASHVPPRIGNASRRWFLTYKRVARVSGIGQIIVIILLRFLLVNFLGKIVTDDVRIFRIDLEY